MEQAIRAALSPDYPWADRFHYFDTIDSTNNFLKRQALLGAPHGTVAVADCQTGGMGRLGRSFQSPGGVGIYLSMLLRPECPQEQLMHLTCAVGAAMCDAVEASAGFRPGIKWTNDLVLNGKKLCGILTEIGLEGESHALDYLVPGIGINVAQTPEDFGPELAATATSLSCELGRPVRRADIAVAVIRALDRMYAGFPQNKPEYLERYRADCLTPGNQVQLITPNSRREAYAVEIDDQFRLVVEFPDGTRQALSAGEVSVRGMYGYV